MKVRNAPQREGNQACEGTNCSNHLFKSFDFCSHSIRADHRHTHTHTPMTLRAWVKPPRDGYEGQLGYFRDFLLIAATKPWHSWPTKPFPLPPHSSLTPFLFWLTHLRLGKVQPSDVAQPSVAQSAWFNAAGTSEGYCAGSCDAAGSRQKPHGGSLWRDAGRGQDCGDSWDVQRRKEGSRRAEGSPQGSSLIKIFNTSEGPYFDSLKEHGDQERGGRQLIVHPETRGEERKKRRGDEEANNNGRGDKQRFKALVNNPHK